MKEYLYTIDGRKTAKGGLITLTVFTFIYIGVFIYFYLNYDDYSKVVQTIRHPNGIEKGLAPSIVGFGYFFIPLAFLGIFVMSKTRDFKKISCGINENEIFLNTSLIRSTTYNLSNIKDVKDADRFIEIQFNDYTDLIKNQFFLFRGIAKKNYITKGQYILLSKMAFMDGKGNDVAAFLKSKMNHI